MAFCVPGVAETKSHTRHPHSGGSAHHRSIRADVVRTNNNITDSPDYIQIYSKQNVKLVLECTVNINFSASIWLKDGQIVQTVLKDNTYSKRVVGHRFLVDASGNLYIDNVRLEDDGRWQCEAEDVLGFIVTGKPIQLTVLGKFLRVLSFIKNYGVLFHVQNVDNSLSADRKLFKGLHRFTPNVLTTYHSVSQK